MPKPKSLTDKQRETFIDNIPEDQRNPDPKATFDELVELAATTPIPKDSAQSPDHAGYTDTQTHLHSPEDTSGKHSDTSHQSNASSETKNPQ